MNLNDSKKAFHSTNNVRSLRVGVAPKTLNFLVFICCALVILLVASYRRVFLLAPPYDVTAYLVLLEKQSKFSRPVSVTLSYSVVILSSAVLHLAVGDGVSSLALNIIIVTAFISYTRFSHPPAIALTIFSYLTNDMLGFSLTSIIVLAIIFAFSATAKLVHETR